MTLPPATSPAEVITFWRDAGPGKWFSKDAAFDETIRTRFEALHCRASRRELDAWGESAEGALALLLLLDQFPRNLWRGSGHAFATDPLALSIAREAVRRGFDRSGPQDLRVFYYVPFEHSERIEDQDRCVALVEAWIAEGGDADFLRWVHIHRDILVRFGRFPHRNPMLGRESTGEELAFLASGGFAG
jgi:uncharacterized protein (DUF924 family)